MDLLTMGIASSPLQQFLLNSLTEQGLKRIQKCTTDTVTAYFLVMETACNDLQTSIVDKLQHMGEHLFFHLSELHARSKWFDKFGVLGLHEGAAQEVTMSAGKLLTKIDEFLRVIQSVKEDYAAFFLWLGKGS
jgi:hypothetical protein